MMTHVRCDSPAHDGERVLVKVIEGPDGPYFQCSCGTGRMLTPADLRLIGVDVGRESEAGHE